MSRISSTFKKNQEKETRAYLTSVPRTRSPSPARRSSSPNRLRNSGTRPLSSSQELKSIENDYIKNLQQQVYFLELEANHLREQAKKATSMHPKMTAEAERMLHKLRHLQTDVDELNQEVRRKDQSIEYVATEKDRILTRLEQEEIERQKEKRILSEEIAELRRERDRLTLENTRKSGQINYVSSDKEKLELELMNAEDTIRRLRLELDDKKEALRLTRLNLDEKTSQVLESEAHARDLEDRYIKNASILHDRTVSDLRDEIRTLQKRLKEAEMQASDDRRLRTRVENETSDVLQDNNFLQQKINDLERQLARERELRDNADEKRSMSLAELSHLTDREKDLQRDLRLVEDALREEKKRSERLLNQLGKQEEMTVTLDASNGSLKGRAYELDGKVKFLENENKQLKRDKELLVDHVAELQRQLSLRSTELSSKKLKIKDLEHDLDVLETDRIYDSAAQSHKWQEFENLAGSMKSLSRSMARSTSPIGSPRSMRASRKSGKGLYAL